MNWIQVEPGRWQARTRYGRKLELLFVLGEVWAFEWWRGVPYEVPLACETDLRPRRWGEGRLAAAEARKAPDAP